MRVSLSPLQRVTLSTYGGLKGVSLKEKRFHSAGSAIVTKATATQKEARHRDSSPKFAFPSLGWNPSPAVP